MAAQSASSRCIYLYVWLLSYWSSADV